MFAKSVTQEMRKSFLEYAMSVIVARALPDARDGLKPVHRRILFGMHELGLSSSIPHKKSARVVGDVLGKYHPHGDNAVYESMVRMAQNFAMRYPLVDGHGNFGSIDGDGAAAMRYTEVRMSKIASLMVDGIKKNTVDFMLNYDGTYEEPKVLPSRIPNLLVSGATGIAVGMATSIPPHNLTEIINGVIQYARNPEITLDELMNFITAPDFPTGGLLLGISGIKKAYETGRGSVRIRSKTKVEELSNGKARIVVEEIPYMINKANMIEKIAQLVKDKVIEGITDLRDETSRKGIRIVIELKKGVIPEVVLNKLFKMSKLQINFSINMISLVNKTPKILPLKNAIEVYFNHQVEIVKRRTQFDLDKSVNRAHILEGLKVAIQNIDKIINIIKKAPTDVVAQEILTKEFKLSKTQVKSIIEMKLGRLTGLAVEKMNNELDELTSNIKRLKNIIDNHDVLVNLIISELEAIRDAYGDNRRSEVVDFYGDIDDEDLIPQKDVAVSMSSKGYVKRIPLENYSIQNRGGVGSRTMTTYDDDDVEKIVTTNTHVDLLVFTTYGKVYRMRVHQIPELSKQAKGTPFINLLPIDKQERIVSLLPVENYFDNEYLLTISTRGKVKKTKISDYKKINRSGKKALKLDDNDSLVKALIVTNDEEIIIGSSNGMVVRFDSKDVRPMGRVAAGVRGIKLDADQNAKVVGGGTTLCGDYILSVGKNGFGKKNISYWISKDKTGSQRCKIN